MTLRSPPRTFGKAATSASGDAPAEVSSRPASVPDFATAASKCSVETYSSPPADAISSAFVTMFATARESCGWATVAPAALGRPFNRPATWVPMAAGSAPTARNSPGAVDPSVPSSATSRCAGSTVALPALVAALMAPASTSRLFVVRISVFMLVFGIPSIVGSDGLRGTTHQS